MTVCMYIQYIQLFTNATNNYDMFHDEFDEFIQR